MERLNERGSKNDKRKKQKKKKQENNESELSKVLKPTATPTEKMLLNLLKTNENM